MILTRLKLANWKNFIDVEMKLSPRTFIIGNNGTGKSNLLDALRFLRDLANPKGGGLQSAVDKRGGMQQVRSLSARSKPNVGVCVEVSENGDEWKYELVVTQEKSGKRRALLKSEKISKNGEIILERPNGEDETDTDRRTQTALEQTNFNKEFRELANFFQSFKYLHTVPQLIRHSAEIQGHVLPDDPFGQDMMNTIASINKKTQQSRLQKIGNALKQIKPMFAGNDIGPEFFRDDKTGKPHLKFRYPNWRPHGAWQTEESLSDGELRLIGLLWTLLECNSVTLLEEPELSFNEGIIRQLPGIFAKAASSKKKGVQQIILTTHSEALLADGGIDGNEVLLLKKVGEGTKVQTLIDIPAVKADLDAGLSVADSALMQTQTADIIYP